METTPKKQHNSVEKIWEAMRKARETAEESAREATAKSAVTSGPLYGLDEKDLIRYPYLFAFLGAHLSTQGESCPQGSISVWKSEEGLTAMTYWRDTECRAFHTASAWEALAQAMEDWAAITPYKWQKSSHRATRGSRRASGNTKPK